MRLPSPLTDPKSICPGSWKLEKDLPAPASEAYSTVAYYNTAVFPYPAFPITKIADGVDYLWFKWYPVIAGGSTSCGEKNTFNFGISLGKEKSDTHGFEVVGAIGCQTGSKQIGADYSYSRSITVSSSLYGGTLSERPGVDGVEGRAVGLAEIAIGQRGWRYPNSSERPSGKAESAFTGGHAIARCMRECKCNGK
jgi:hypothetical protein